MFAWLFSKKRSLITEAMEADREYAAKVLEAFNVLSAELADHNDRIEALEAKSR